MISELIKKYVQAVIYYSEYQRDDEIYLINKVAKMIGEDIIEDVDVEEINEQVIQEHYCVELVEQLVDRSCSNNIVLTPFQKEQLACELLDLITPLPSVLKKTFYSYRNKEDATNYFYKLCRRNNYIKTREIEKNINFDYHSKYGKLNITINLSKPEKDPRDIEKQSIQQEWKYPKCLLCQEQVGFAGRHNNPCRINHRIIPIILKQTMWGLQYSPYSYYPEHCIVLKEQHDAMKISEQTFFNLLELVHQLPHYFFGSNADLPIVGGSILSHDHYQGGRYIFPMDNAKVLSTFHLKSYPTITIQLLQWPMSVIRLCSQNRKELIRCATNILNHWKDYSNDMLNIKAYTNGVSNHTITPIARYRNNQYELNLVLRDNHTTLEFPDGVFHPHQDVQHIKKENIGLIEVMGLAILPPRLKREIEEIKCYLLGNSGSDIAIYHKQWVSKIKQKYANISEENIDQILQKEIGKKFERVLEDSGVFKQNEKGIQAFKDFILEL